MWLTQILLPLYTNAGQKIPPSQFKQVKNELTARYKGLTAYNRSVAEGLWEKGNATKRDAIIVYEVMASTADKSWWQKYRKTLEERFQQENIVIRAQRIDVF